MNIAGYEFSVDAGWGFGFDENGGKLGPFAFEFNTQRYEIPAPERPDY